MDRRQIILAAFASVPKSETLAPVQVQKLLFLIDREAASLLGGPFFAFEPYDFGPFDRAVYDTLDFLLREQLVFVDHNFRPRRYGLTTAGYERGLQELADLDQSSRSYLREITTWVLRLNFSQLVTAIYKKYPEMKAKSIFK